MVSIASVFLSPKPARVQALSFANFKNDKITSEKQSIALNKDDAKIVKDILSRWNLTPTDDDLTYDEHVKWSVLDSAFKKRNDPSNFMSDEEGAGVALVDPLDNKIKSYIFSHPIKNEARKLGLPYEDVRRFVAIQEAGTKALRIMRDAKPTSIDTQRIELVTEAMSVRAVPEMGYKVALMYLIGGWRGYNAIRNVAYNASLRVMEKYGIGGDTPEERAATFRDLHRKYVPRYNPTDKEFHLRVDDFISALAEKKVEPKELINALTKEYARALDDAAYSDVY